DSSRGTTINLERGNVIVEAARQRQRHLYVATDDCLVSVTGTIFSVNSGTKGSRVSVVEGEVRVNSGGRENVLHPGDQTTTSASLGAVPLKDEIAWSRDADRYAKLVGELVALRKEIDQKVSLPGVRYESRLINLAPEGTVLYAALPNMSATISESYRLMQERINQNAALREWWASEHKEDSARKGAELGRIIESIREAGEYLGDEIVVTAAMDERGEPGSPLVLAELRNPEGFRSFIERQLAALTSGAKDAPAVRFIDDPLAATAQAQPSDGKGRNGRNEIFVWIAGDTFAAAPGVEQLRRLAEVLKAPAANRFAATPFYARIAETYREGAGLIVAADLEKIVARLVKEDANSP
ncbi:MAG: FecR domain-containing protein, partial [Pyrinomonadaceae bacterium]